jgi:hypothetical protein
VIKKLFNSYMGRRRDNEKFLDMVRKEGSVIVMGYSWLGQWFGGKQIKPGFAESVTVFTVEAVWMFSYFSCFPDCAGMLCIYKIPHSCGKVYISQTGCQITRISKHIRETRLEN